MMIYIRNGAGSPGRKEEMLTTISDNATTYRIGRLVLTSGWCGRGIEMFRTASEADEWEAWVHAADEEAAEPIMAGTVIY